MQIIVAGQCLLGNDISVQFFVQVFASMLKEAGQEFPKLARFERRMFQGLYELINQRQRFLVWRKRSDKTNIVSFIGGTRGDRALSGCL